MFAQTVSQSHMAPASPLRKQEVVHRQSCRLERAIWPTQKIAASPSSWPFMPSASTAFLKNSSRVSLP